MIKAVGLRPQWWLAGVSCAVIGAAAGAVLTLTGAGAVLPFLDSDSPADSPLIGEPGGALEVVDSGSSEITFPAGLGGLGVTPTDVTVDRSGRVWAVGMSSSNELLLLHGSTSGSKLGSYSIRTDQPSVWPRLEVDGAGRLVIAAGTQVIRVQPDTLEYETIPVPVLADVAIGLAAPRAAIDLRLEGGSVFLSGRSADSITFLDPDSGKTEEILVPESFGGYDDFLVSRDKIWLLKTGDTTGGAQSQVGILDRASGELVTVPVKVFSAGLTTDGLTAITWDPAGLVHVGPDGRYSRDSVTLAPEFAKRLSIQNWVVGTDGGLWLIDTMSGSIVWKKYGSDTSIRYQLPTWKMEGEPMSCPVGADCNVPVNVGTQISGVAAAPDGTLYFADTTLNRIGLVKPPE